MIIELVRLRRTAFFFLLLFFQRPAFGQRTDGDIVLAVRLRKKSDSVGIYLAPLKYNKTFAFSFTLDDGLISAYKVAFPFFNGGKVSGPYKDQWKYDQGGDGKYYPGLYFTDGCGHRIAFRAAMAINAGKIEGSNTVDHPGFLSWSQIDSMYRAGWELLNHGYMHRTGLEVKAGYEVSENNKVLKDVLNIDMKGFVIPGGKDDLVSDGAYTEAAFDMGMQTVQCEHFGDYILIPDKQSTLSHLKLGRKFLHSALTDSTRSNGAALFNEINTHLRDGKSFWVNAFTHGVGNQNIWGISLTFTGFKNIFDKLASRYGEQGCDCMWMAPTQEVYEYLRNRRALQYDIHKKGKWILLRLHAALLPSGSKYREFTFVMRPGQRIKKIHCDGCIVESYSSGEESELINLKW